MAGARIDLDAARAARREAVGELGRISFGGKEFELPLELPFEVSEFAVKLASAGAKTSPESVTKNLRSIVELVLGDQYRDFMKLRPSMDDLLALVDGLSGAYGFGDLGESPASAPS